LGAPSGPEPVRGTTRAAHRIALIGLSWITADLPAEASHPVVGTAIPYSHASALAAIPGTHVVAGCDIVAGARDTFVERWSPRWPGLRVYHDYREMLAEERPDVVGIATPDHLHGRPMLAAIDAGARGILCEKPLATSLAEADELVAAAEKAGTVVNVNYTRRWIPEWVEARRMVRAREFGKLSQIVAEIGGPRAMLFRNHTHVIDLICYLADAAPEWVIAELEPGFEDYGTGYRGDGGNDPATEPGANYYVGFENGVRAYVTGMKDTLGSDMVVHLTGPEGRLMIDLEGMRLHSTYNEDIRTKPGVPSVRPITPHWTIAGFQAAWQDLLDVLDNGGEVQSPASSARLTAALTDAILLSQQRGNVRVRLDELASGDIPSTVLTG
jgi:predicted dehydrogenase